MSEDRIVSPSRTKKKRLSRPEAMMAEAVSVLSNIKNKPEETKSSTDDDEDTIFGKYVTTELRKVQDQGSKDFLKFKIQSLFFETQYRGMTPSMPSSSVLQPAQGQSQQGFGHWSNSISDGPSYTNL